MGDGSDHRHGKATRPGYGPVGGPAPSEDDPPEPGNAADFGDDPTLVDTSAGIVDPDASPYDRIPLVEIEVVHEHGPAPQGEHPWRTVEVWTRNRIYTMDSTMQCIDVADRATHASVPNHGFLGARLVGGQHQSKGVIELSHPFPRPGTEAVFEAGTTRHGGFSRTSTVTRVVLRLHVVTVAPSSVVPTWSEISTSLTPPPPTDD